jgi:hypothetical protein
VGFSTTAVVLRFDVSGAERPSSAAAVLVEQLFKQMQRRKCHNASPEVNVSTDTVRLRTNN